MADETHILNLIARLKDDASRGVATLDKNIKNLKKSMGDLSKSNKDLEQSNRKLGQSEDELARKQKVLEGQQKRLNNEADRYNNIIKHGLATEEKKAEATKKLERNRRDLIDVEKQLNVVYEEQKTILREDTDAVGGHTNALQRLKAALGDNRDELGKNSNWLTKFAHNTDEASSSSRRLESRLIRLGRAMLGLGIASVIVFMQSFLSSLVAVGGQVVALGGSLIYAAGALGGTFVAALGQAIPVIGIFAAALQRLSVIQDAVNQHNLIQKQSAGEAASSMEAQKEAANGVREAEESLADAQQALNEARREGVREVQDLIAAEKEAELQMESAVLAQRDAKFALEDAMDTGDIGGIAEAQLSARERALERSNARRSLRRARTDANKAREGGVESLDSVKSATEAVDDATRRLAEAHREAAVQAQDQSAAENSLQYFLNQLSPAEKELYRAIIRFQERFKELFTPITDVIIRSMTRAVGKFQELITDPAIVEGFSNLADRIAEAMDKIVNIATNERAREFWVDMLRHARNNLGPIEDIVSNLWRLFQNIATAAAPVLHNLLKRIADITGDWADETERVKPLTEFFTTGLKHLRAWGRLLMSAVNLLGALMGVSGQSAIQTINDLTDRLNGAAESLRENRKIAEFFFADTAKAFGYLIDIIVSIGKGLIDAFDADTVKAFRDLLDDAIIPGLVLAVDMTGELIKVFNKLLHQEVFGAQVADIIKYGIALKIVVGSAGLLASLLLGIVAPIQFVAGLFLDLEAALGAVGIGFGTATAELEGMALMLRVGLIATGIGAAVAAVYFFKDEIIDGFQSVAEKVKEPLEGLIEAFRHLAQTIENIFGHGGKLSGILGIFRGAIRSTFDWIGDYLAGWIEFLQGFVEIVDGILSGDFGKIWEGLKHMVGGALRGILGLLDHLTQPFEDAGKVLGNAFADAFTFAFEKAKDAVTFFIDKALGALSTILNTVNDVIDAAPGALLPPGTGDVGNAAKDAADSIDEFREQLRGEHDDVEQVDLGLQQYNKTLEKSGIKSKDLKGEQTKLGESYKEAFRRSAEAKEGVWKYGKQLGGLIETLLGTGKQSSELGRVMRDVTNKVLKAFGADEINFDVPTVKDLSKGLGSGLAIGMDAIGGLFGAQSGGYLGYPGLRGPDDRLIAVAGGEAVLTGHHQREVNEALAMKKYLGAGGYGSLGEMFARDRREHRTAPKYQSGGIIPNFQTGGALPGVSTAGMHPGILKLASALISKFPGLSVSSGVRPGDPGFHGQGLAVDLAGDINYLHQVASWIDRSKVAPTLLEGIHNPTLSWDSGHPVPPSFWGAGTWAGHVDHIHLAVADAIGNIANSMAGASGVGFGAPKIGRAKIKGPDGPLKDMLQRQADKLRGAGNKELMKQLGASGVISGNYQGPLNRVFPEHTVGQPGVTLSQQQVMMLARRAGLPPITFAQIARGESGFAPGIVSSDGGYGLWQMTPRVWGPPAVEHMNKLGGLGQMLNPWKNALMAKYLFDSAGGTISPWFGTSFVTDFSPPYRQRGGFAEFDDGGVVPGRKGSKQLVVAHGGETILPTHKYQSGGGVPILPPNIVRQNYRDIRRSIRDTAAIQTGEFDVILNNLTDLLREGGPFDDLAESIAAMTEYLANSLTEWMYRIRKGIIGNIRTNMEVANQELDNLEIEARHLGREVDLLRGTMIQVRQRIKEVNHTLRQEENKHKREDLQDQRDQLRTALTNIRLRLQELDTAIAENLASRYEQQNAIFDAAIARFDQRLSLNDLRRQIQEARNQLHTPEGEDVDNTNLRGFYNQRGRILDQEQRRIEKELRKARRAHDIERQRELREALLQNKLAQIENTQAIKDLIKVEEKTNEIFSFNTTAWELFRVAILNGMGGVMPQYSVPSLQTGGMVTREGLVHLHAGEVVTPAEDVGDTIIKITEPMEVADPVALSNAIAWKLKTTKT